MEITVEVTRTITVTLDETKFTPEFMDEYREDFYSYNSIEDHARHLAFLKANGMIPRGKKFIEGYGRMSDMGIKFKIERNYKTKCI